MRHMDDTTPLPEFLVRLPEGVLRVAGTCVSVDSVVLAFQDGTTPEEICLDFPSLDLARVYSILAYYLTHRDAVDAYLRRSTSPLRRLTRTSRRATAHSSLS